MGSLRPPHHAIGKGGLKHFGVIAERDHQPASHFAAEKIVECGGERGSLCPSNADAMPCSSPDSSIKAMRCRSATSKKSWGLEERRL